MRVCWLFRILTGFALLLMITGCDNRSGKITETGRIPVLEPDISGITIPVNIAPINFNILENGGEDLLVSITSGNSNILKMKAKKGKVRFSVHAWKKLVGNPGDSLKFDVSGTQKNGEISRYNSFYIKIADPADQYLCYRLLYPGYETYYDIKIIQRDISSFSESPVVENGLMNHNCVNCHSFSNNSPSKFLIHARGDLGGTFFIDGKVITKADFRSDSLSSGAVYPAWRKDGKYIVFSSNNIRQSFHARHDLNIEVTDLSSKLVLYDVENKSVSAVKDTGYMDTFPEWSPDGSYIYFCRAKQYKEGDDPLFIRYNLMRRPFSESEKSFGPAELVFDAVSIGKSVSFPRISPNGDFLVFTLHDYGNFSIWHKEADLYLLDLRSQKAKRMDLNSEQAESWHCWSSNSKWLVFSSKREDGLTARPYFAYIASADRQGKPFILPQRDPGVYGRMILTFNRPEFITGKIMTGPRDFAKAAGLQATKPLWK